MKCEICKKEVLLKNSIVCSEKCKNVRKKIIDLNDKYFPTHGCDNCWGDLHQGCSSQCNLEHEKSFGFGKDLWSIINLIYN